MNELYFKDLYTICINDKMMPERNRMIPVLKGKLEETLIAKSLVEAFGLSNDDVFVTNYGSKEDMEYDIDIIISPFNISFNCKSVNERNINSPNYSGPLSVKTDFLIFYDYCEFNNLGECVDNPNYFYCINANKYMEIIKELKPINNSFYLIDRNGIKENSIRFNFKNH